MKKLDLKQEQKQFIDHLELKGKSFNTLKNYRTDLNIFGHYLEQKGRPLIINDITLSEVKEYGSYLEKKYNSPNSIRRRVQALRMFFDYLITKDYFQENPIKNMPVSPKVVDLPKPATFEALLKLKTYLQKSADESSGHEKLLYQRNLILFYLIYGAGLKVSDIEKLSVEHIKKVKNSYRLLIIPDKREPFSVSLPESSTVSIEEYLTLLEDGKSRDQIEFNQFLFNGNPFRIIKGGLSARGIEVIFKEFSRLLDEQLTAKGLRQACIFKWLGQQVPQSRIKEWMGVQPQYSLGPYTALMKNYPDKYAYVEV